MTPWCEKLKEPKCIRDFAKWEEIIQQQRGNRKGQGKRKEGKRENDFKRMKTETKLCKWGGEGVRRGVGETGITTWHRGNPL